jgi:hypothetical protein
MTVGAQFEISVHGIQHPMRYRVWTCRAGEPGFQIDPETEEVTWTYAGLGGRSLPILFRLITDSPA